MDHRGAIVQEIVKLNGITIVKLAGILKLSKQAVYNQFNNPNLQMDKIARIGNAIGYDFSAEFPKLFGVREERPVAVPSDVSVKVTVELDGSLERLERAIEKIRNINNVMNK